MVRKKAEVAEAKSAAEFFTENQNIAGFDNPGKSLFTTIRELVENSLDACESVGVAPDITVRIDELSQEELDASRGLSMEVTEKKTFYRVCCADNGCGMPRSAIPEMMGRVLSGSKYGVRQTRGKFGLGAKMALVWAKKSSGLPIVIRSSTDSSGRGARVVLDIDVRRNEPRVLEDGDDCLSGRGSEVTVTVGGSSHYKARIATYFEQLAIITPYADLKVTFKDLCLQFKKRSEKIPDPPKTTGYHPSSLNELLVQQLVERSKTSNIETFLTKGEIAGISKDAAKSLASQVDMTEVPRLSRLLRDVKCKAPDASVLSPVGEYNLRLGISKEMKPTYTATHSKSGSYQGHPFIVEAAVALGATTGKDDVTVHRYANRIPLLFEGGSDVSTRVAKHKIKWTSYNIDQKKDNVACFVSLVSTKIPFKGTSKEYIGEDANEIRDAVKSCLQSCCQQLKVKLVQRDNDRRLKDREKHLLKYAPDAAAALYKVLDPLRSVQTDQPERFALRRRLPSQLSQKYLVDKMKQAVDRIVENEDDKEDKFVHRDFQSRPSFSKEPEEYFYCPSNTLALVFFQPIYLPGQSPRKKLRLATQEDDEEEEEEVFNNDYEDLAMTNNVDDDYMALFEDEEENDVAVEDEEPETMADAVDDQNEIIAIEDDDDVKEEEDGDVEEEENEEEEEDDDDDGDYVD